MLDKNPHLLARTPQELPPEPSEAELAFARVLEREFGPELAAEVPMILRLLPDVATKYERKSTEGDLEGFCRYRLAKREIHKAQGPEEHFERVRLLNMMYERALEYLQNLSSETDYCDSIPKEELRKKTLRIIEHLDEALDTKIGDSISRELHRLYCFMTTRLKDSSIDFRQSALDVMTPLRQIYLGYLELELQADLEAYFELLLGKRE